MSATACTCRSSSRPAASSASSRGSRSRNAMDSSIRPSACARLSARWKASSSAACSAALFLNSHRPLASRTGTAPDSQRRRANSRVPCNSSHSARHRSRRAAPISPTTSSSDITPRPPPVTACSASIPSDTPGGINSPASPGPNPSTGTSPSQGALVTSPAVFISGASGRHHRAGHRHGRLSSLTRRPLGPSSASDSIAARHASSPRPSKPSSSSHAGQSPWPGWGWG